MGNNTLKYFVLLVLITTISLWTFHPTLQTAVLTNHGPTKPAVLATVPRRQPLNTTCTNPRAHIVYIKIQKTGSGTLKLNILEPYGIKNKLVFVEMYSGARVHGLNYPNHILSSLITPSIQHHYDMMISESRYNPEVTSRLMPKDSFYFFSVRHPVARFLSAFYFSGTNKRIGELLGITEPLKILQAFLKYPKWMLDVLLLQGKAKVPQIFMVKKNQQLFDLGFDEDDMNSSDLESKIDQVISEFDMVVITEYFNESMILLRRKLCWKLEDILYTKEHVGKRALLRVSDLPQKVYDQILEYNAADMILYNKAEKRFWEMLKKETGYEKELHLYTKQLDGLANKCADLNKMDLDKDTEKCPKTFKEIFEIRKEYRKTQIKQAMSYNINYLKTKLKINKYLN